ncbi:tandem-95 repeat protein [uncultured Photobacterium sp.]|uniref:Ig-like domain-containing protein n=1 Tax=uncultured Photobacterium sp. TaxID=173973 RepID=UPI00261CC153|nr:tandem-95 repeat protein [uncultured Photobacterium sp.]
MFTDSAGNTNTAATLLSISLDTVLPGISIGSDTPSLKAGETAALTFTLSEASSDFAESDITVVGGSLSGFAGSGTTYTATFTPDSDRSAAATIDVAGGVFTDSAGNTNTAATRLSVSLDTVLPGVSIGSDTPSLKAGETAALTFTLSESSSDFAESDITVAGGSLSGFSGSGTTYTATFTPDTDRSAAATIDVAGGVFTDSAGNTNTAATRLSVSLDTVLPGISIGSDTPSLKAGETAALTFTLSESSSDFAASDITVVGGSLSGFSGSGTTYTATFTPDTDRSVAATIDVAVNAFTDSAGNTNTAATQLSLSLDTVLPGISIGSDTPSLKAGETASLTFTLSEASSDFAASDITVVGGSLSGFAGSGTTYTATFTPDSDRTAAATIDVAVNAFTDSAGNTNTAATQLSISLDTLLPTVTIGSDKTELKAEGTANITFALSEASSDFAVGDITVENGVLSNFTGSEASYSATLTPSDDGTVTLDVSKGAFTDMVGNESLAASQVTVSYDGTSPKPVISSNANAITNADFVADIDFGEPVTGFSLDKITVVNASLSALVDKVDGQYQVTVTPDSDGMVSLDVAAGSVTDSVGNNNLAAERYSLEFDGSRPYLQQMTPEDDAGNVQYNTLLELSFSENIIAGEGSISIYDVDDGLFEAVSMNGEQIVIDGAKVSISLLDKFIPTHSYYVHISSDALSDKAGNTFVGIDDSTSYNFTIGNNVPQVAADTATVAEDNSVAIVVLDNDSDSDSEINPASVTVTTKPAHGNTSVNTGTGVVTYSPEKDFAGTDRFYYRVEDVYGGQSDTAKVTITVTPVDDSPVAVADVVSTDEDTSVLIDILANDTDPDEGDSTDRNTLVIASQPGHGSVTIENGQVSYEPDRDYTGSDVFTYTVRDTSGRLSNVAEVRVNIAGVNDAPRTVADDVVTDEDTAVEVSVLANDSDIDGTVDVATVAVVRQPDNGTVSVSELGVVTYTPKTNFNGADSFTYVVEDNEGAISEAAIVNMTVNSVNDAPVANDDIATLLEDSTHSINVLGNDDDVDGQLNSGSVTVISQPEQGNVSVADSGVILFTPVGNFNGEDSFTYQVSDELGLVSNTAKVTITVQSVNDTPLANDDNVTTTEDNDVTINVIANDSDVDGSLDTSTLTLGTAPVSGTLRDNGDGTLTYTPDENSHGIDSFTYSISDNEGGVSNTAIVTIEIEAVNDAPTLSGTPTTEVAQDGSYNFVPQASDIDGDNFTFSISNLPDWAEFDSSVGILSGSPGNDDVGTYSNIVISVSDGVATVSLPAFAITVTNVNDAPTINGTPSTQVDEDSRYSFTPIASDIDDDTLAFNIANKPDWASFDTRTGTLSGSPTNSDVGLSSGIVITVTDGEESVSLSAFNITVTNVNDTPLGESLSVSVAEDNSVIIAPNLQDIDGDRLGLLVIASPQHGALESNGLGWRYTPQENYFGDDEFSYQVTDGQVASTSYSVNIAVSAVNDIPLAVDDSFVITANNSGSYTLDVLSNDTDIENDDLRLEWVSAEWGAATVQNGIVLFTSQLTGTVTLGYSVTDGNGGSDNGQVRLTIESDALQVPQITSPDDVELNATALFTKVDLGVAVASDSNGKVLPVSLVDNQTFFEPGNNMAYWRTEDSQGNVAEASQKVTIHPLVTIAKDSETTEGATQRVQVFLNGQSPSYPVTIPYTVSGTSGPNDHDLRDSNVVIASGTVGEIQFSIHEDQHVEGLETLIITLDPAINLGSKKEYTLSIQEQNVAPKVVISVVQQTEQRQLIENTDDLVTITAQVTDANTGDNHDYQWMSTESLLADISQEPEQYVFSPAQLSPGIYLLKLTVTDNAVEPLSVSTDIYIEVVEQLASLGSEDMDGDLIPDNQEGFSDSDSDGIPDYQDAISECNVIQEQVAESDSYLVEGEPGVCLRKGVTLAGNETGGAQLLDSEISSRLGADQQAENIGGIFDFVAYGLPQVGQSYQVVFPQRLPIPANAVYRKFVQGSGWVDFVTNEFNYLSSTQGEAGYCPPPGDSRWTSGLTEGHWCVQVTIQDGGPNDDDGIANGSVIDPGGVAARASTNTLPVAQDDTVTISRNSSIIIDALANDSDADGNILDIANASADFGSVVVDNNQLNYTAEDKFYGVATVSYSITDNSGGTAFASVTVNVVNSLSPKAEDDQVETDDRTALVINVLGNDSDPDGDSLTVVSAVAQKGLVSINTDQTITYIPKRGYEGIDTVTYRIRDVNGLEATATVKVQTKLMMSVVIENESGGGVGGVGLMLLTLFGFVRCYGRKLWLALLLLVISFNSQANWFIEADLGMSSTDERSNVKAATVIDSDDSDFYWTVGLGYALSPKWELTVRYIDQGQGSATISNSTTSPDEYHQSVALVAPALVSGIGLDVSYSLLQVDAFNIDVSVGGIDWETDFESTYQGRTIKSSDEGVDPYLGIELGYTIAENWVIGLEATRYFIDINDVDTFSLKLKYRFIED